MSSNILAALKKRRAYPVVLGEDSTVNVRALTIGELDRLKALKPELKTGFVMGCAIVDSAGTAQFAKSEETDAEFSERVMQELADVSTETIALISQAISKIGKVPEPEVIAKN